MPITWLLNNDPWVVTSSSISFSALSPETCTSQWSTDIIMRLENGAQNRENRDLPLVTERKGETSLHTRTSSLIGEHEQWNWFLHIPYTAQWFRNISEKALAT